MIPREALDAVRWLAYQALRQRSYRVALELLEGCYALDPSHAWTAQALTRTRSVLQRSVAHG